VNVEVDIGAEMHRWASDLFPICRSLTGDGVRQTLRYFHNLLPNLAIHEVPSGTRVFDWNVPPEWNIRDAYVADDTGRRVIDFREHNLHVVGYSEPVDTWLTLDELQTRLYSTPEQPDAIPLVVSYYTRTWGFCLRHRDRQKLKSGHYHVVVDSTLDPSGHLTYGELLLPGESADEVLVSCNICHASMANNELSGPVVVAALACWLMSAPRGLSYRIVFIPENIGSVVYLSRNLAAMKERIIAGFVVSCAGDERAYSMVASRLGDTLTDRLLRHVLRHHAGVFKEYAYLWPHRGSDERNYCSPGVELPVVAFTRSKYGEFPEYHTSLDDLSFVTPRGLAGSLDVLKKCVSILEGNKTYRLTCLGEPRLGPRGLYPSMNKPGSGYEEDLTKLMNVIAYCDGNHSVLDIAERIGIPAWHCLPIIDRLRHEQLVEVAAR
jgi:aminopeptidase-like protein